MPAAHFPIRGQIDGMLVHAIPHDQRDEVTYERPKVDAHVKHVVAGVAQGAIRLVKVAHKSGNVGLEGAVAKAE